MRHKEGSALTGNILQPRYREGKKALDHGAYDSYCRGSDRLTKFLGWHNSRLNFSGFYEITS